MSSRADDLFSLVYDLDEYMFATTVDILRGTYQTDSVPAIVQVTDHEIVDQETGITTITRSRDYIIRKEDYVVNEVATEPRRGDVILEVVGGASRYFECVPFSTAGASKDLPAFEEEDADGLRWLIRTKSVLYA